MTDIDSKELKCLVEILFELFSQEIYLILPCGTKVLIPYQQYRKDPIASWSINNSEGFITENDELPLNLVGPVVTKVIQWNIDQCEKSLTKNISKDELKPGYLIDLRGLLAPRLRYLIHSSINTTSQHTTDNKNVSLSNLLKQNKATIDKELDGHCEKLKKTITELGIAGLPLNLRKLFDDIIELIPLDEHQGKKLKFVEVPDEFLFQLKEPLENANLYIVSWQNPLDTHNQAKLGNVQLNYIPQSEFTQLISNPQDESEQTLQPKPDNQVDCSVQKYLTDYFQNTGAQLGLLNPLDKYKIDLEDNPQSSETRDLSVEEKAAFYVTCYIANLKSFNQN